MLENSEPDKIERTVERIPTGIIDDLISGGIPRGSVVLLIGDPKAGKSTFLAQFTYNQLQIGIPVIGVLVDLSKYEFVSNALDFGWEFMPYLDERLVLLDAYTQRLRKAPKFSFDETVVTDVSDTTQLLDAIKDSTLKLLSNTRTENIVGFISSMTPIFFETSKREIYKFLEELREFAHRNRQVWVLEMNSGIEEPHVEMMVKAIVDGIIELRLMEEGKSLRRYLRIYGMRRTAHKLEWIQYEITSSGIKLLL
ncbi:RAD55 family ATPase [Pyrococcus yayanosii]|nr:RAD55 family ATPase [Pyrococcus yayanosii]